jgi:hypothetical protein
VPINTFREHLTGFSNVKSVSFFTLELVYKVGGFAVDRGGDGISEAGVGAGEQLGRNVDGTCLAAGTVTGEGSTCGCGGTRAEDLAEVGQFAEVDGGGIFRKLRVAGSEERMWKPSQRIRLSFGRPG